MDRNSHELWVHFTKVREDGFKTLRAKFNHCRESVSNTPSNMKTHLTKCNKIRRMSTIGQAQSIGISSRFISIAKRSSNDSVFRSGTKLVHLSPNLNHLIENTITPEEKKEIDLLFAKAIHETATPFYFFDHPSWISFLHVLRPNWKVPAPTTVGGSLLDVVVVQ